MHCPSMARGPVKSIICLTNPTKPRTPLTSEDGETCWRLVNHLNSNFLSLSDRQRGSLVAGHESVDSVDSATALLRRMLYLYCPEDQPSMRRQIDGILSVKNESVTRQLPFAGPIVHGRGVHLALQMDETAFEGGGSFLLGSVLEQFMARFVSLNSFTQTSLSSPTRGPVHRWPVRTGTVSLI